MGLGGGSEKKRPVLVGRKIFFLPVHERVSTNMFCFYPSETNVYLGPRGDLEIQVRHKQ